MIYAPKFISSSTFWSKPACHIQGTQLRFFVHRLVPIQTAYAQKIGNNSTKNL